MTKKKATPKKKKATPKKKLPKQKQMVPISKGQQCRARVKTCQNPECKYKFAAGDKSWNCPNCGRYRRCNAKAVHPFTVCRMHGAGGGRPPTTGKFIPPQQIADAYNAVYEDPSLLSLATNIALSEARTQDLLAMIDDNDIRAQAGDISVGLNMLLNAVVASAEEIERVSGIPQFAEDEDGEPFEWNLQNSEWMIKQIREIREALTPAVHAQKVWRQVNEQLEITRRLNDTERKWIDQHDQMVPMSQVIEAMAIVIRMALKFIPNAQDRSKFAKQMRELVPKTE